MLSRSKAPTDLSREGKDTRPLCFGRTLLPTYVNDSYDVNCWKLIIDDCQNETTKLFTSPKQVCRMCFRNDVIETTFETDTDFTLFVYMLQ